SASWRTRTPPCTRRSPAAGAASGPSTPRPASARADRPVEDAAEAAGHGARCLIATAGEGWVLGESGRAVRDKRTRSPSGLARSSGTRSRTAPATSSTTSRASCRCRLSWKGQRLGLFYRSANFDEAVFENPERFDIMRSPNPHLGFGGTGAHYCI